MTIQDKKDKKDWQGTERIVFVCSGNTCRSPMASALARKHLPWAQVLSAGVATVTGLPASIGAMDAIQEFGLSLDDHQSRPVSLYLLQEAELVLCMGGSHKRALLDYYPEGADKIFTLAEFVESGSDIPDPFGMPVEEYIKCAGELERLILLLAEKCAPAAGNAETN